MFVAAAVVTVLLVLALVGSAVGKLVKAPQVTASLEAVGVPPRYFPHLALVSFAIAAGLVAGLFWAPVGVAAAAAAVAYFAGAVAAHLRAKDPNLQGAAVLAVVAVLAFGLRLATV